VLFGRNEAGESKRANAIVIFKMVENVEKTNDERRRDQRRSRDRDSACDIDRRNDSRIFADTCDLTILVLS